MPRMVEAMCVGLKMKPFAELVAVDDTYGVEIQWKCRYYLISAKIAHVEL